MRNTANELGGAIYCVQDRVTLEEGTLAENFAQSNGGGIFTDTCQVTIDYIQIVNNIGLMYGGGICSVASVTEIHNTEGVNNSAGNMGSFGVITKKSKFESNYLRLDEGTVIVVSNSSNVAVKHTYLSNMWGYCPIISIFGSDISVDSIYLTDQNDTKHNDSENNKNIVCTDSTSKAQGTPKGIFVSFFQQPLVSAFKNLPFRLNIIFLHLEKFPSSCITECRCYSNHHKATLVANCSHSGLTEVPDSVPKHTDWLLLSGNNVSFLTTMNKEINDTFYHLSHLDLDGNNIANISSEIVDGFIQSNTLVYLNISNNKLISLPENIRNLTSLRTLKLSGNNFECSCGNFWMKQWLLNETHVVTEFESIKCKLASGKMISMVHMDKIDMGCVEPREHGFPIWNILGIAYIFTFFFNAKE